MSNLNIDDYVLVAHRNNCYITLVVEQQNLIIRLKHKEYNYGSNMMIKLMEIEKSPHDIVTPAIIDMCYRMNIKIGAGEVVLNLGCEYCNVIDDFDGYAKGSQEDAIFYDRCENKFYLVIEEFRYERTVKPIKYCPECGRKLIKKL